MTNDLGPAVRFPPPLLFVAGLGGGVLLDRLLPAAWRVPRGTPAEVLGVVLGALGLVLVYAGIVTFRRFRTAVYPNRPAKLVVDTGVYGVTRNPMYFGMTLFYLGGVQVLHSTGALLLLPLVLWLLHALVIVREERHLRQAFPAEYDAYCRRVPRWF